MYKMKNFTVLSSIGKLGAVGIQSRYVYFYYLLQICQNIIEVIILSNSTPSNQFLTGLTYLPYA